MTIKEIIQKLHITMTDAGGQESHFESWLTLSEGIIDVIDALKALDKQEPVAWEQFYPDIGKPQLEQLPQLSQEVVLQYPKEAVDWQKQQKEYAQQLKVEGPCHVVCQCDKCKAQEQDNAYIYASNLAKTIWQKHYIKESPKFALLDTTEGVLTQIDNMTCGLVREKPAHPEQYPQIAISPEIVGYVAPQRKPLSDEQIEQIAEGYLVDYRIPAGCAWNFARDIEAAHGIKGD